MKEEKIKIEEEKKKKLALESFEAHKETYNLNPEKEELVRKMIPKDKECIEDFLALEKENKRFVEEELKDSVKVEGRKVNEKNLNKRLYQLLSKSPKGIPDKVMVENFSKFERDYMFREGIIGGSIENIKIEKEITKTEISYLPYLVFQKVFIVKNVIEKIKQKEKPSYLKNMVFDPSHCKYN